MTTPATLSGPERPPQSGKNPTSLVFLLHGYGDSGDGLIPLADVWAPILPDTHFIAPHAPEPCGMMPPGMAGRQWFGLTTWTPYELLEGVKAAAPRLHNTVQAASDAHQVPFNKIALMGFSQGAMMSLYVAPRTSPALAGVLACSGALVGGETLFVEKKSSPPIMLIHGQMDDVVPFAALPFAATALQTLGFQVQTLTRPMMSHSIDDVALQEGGKFLQTILA
ncbi:MAG: phospholipase [Alphaproteobacteria bacterium]|nr:phospholipase [Alphaproteobacteria bacterium]